MAGVANGVHNSEPVVKFVGQKISKVRWKPQPSGAIASSDVFASGSWDDEVGIFWKINLIIKFLMLVV